MDALIDRPGSIIALIGSLALVAMARLGWGDEPAATTQPALKPFIYGARACASCHDLQNRRNDTKEELANWICRMDEFPIYNSKDKHKLAYQALTGARGRRMGELLKADVTRIDACLACHSVPDRGIERQQYTPESDGVTCVACHGAHEEWVEKHQSGSKAWRSLDRERKERLYGMTDLWSPARRAETCASCHIGNHAQGKLLTHAMYAAGHPPLPSFETASFSEAEPRHWQYLGEKTPARLKRLMPDADPRNLERTQLVAISALVELRESMKLIADQAGADKPITLGAAWPDYARFDCNACHHELQAKDGASWRQVRHQGGSPGRPSYPDWPLTLARIAVHADRSQAPGRQEGLDQALGPFRLDLRKRPLGDPATLVPAARSIAQWADGAVKSLEHTTFDARTARSFLDRLCGLAAQAAPDYDSARQIAWAFQIIYHEITPERERDPAIEKAIAGLTAELALDLPPAQTQTPIETTLASRLKKAGDFDPRSFQTAFATIAARLTSSNPIQAAQR